MAIMRVHLRTWSWRRMRYVCAACGLRWDQSRIICLDQPVIRPRSRVEPDERSARVRTTGQRRTALVNQTQQILLQVTLTVGLVVLTLGIALARARCCRHPRWARVQMLDAYRRPIGYQCGEC